MGTATQWALVSDVHYASPEEAARGATIFDPIQGRLRRWFIQLYRRRLWLRDPFGHNHLFERFLAETRGLDSAVANGDYSCDSAYIGVSDPCALTSARTCLRRLRGQFTGRFLATMGDHEIGKKMLGAEAGGLRLRSYHLARHDLALDACWTEDVGRYRMIGITSTLVALPIYEIEVLPEELAEWRALRAEHLAAIERAFAGTKAAQRILLFCHDPTALPFLASLNEVQRRFPQLERTIIGHLHSPAVIGASAWLAGMPEIGFLGHTPRRLSRALRQARRWKPYNILLCPSLTGLQLFKDGGYYILTLDLDARTPVGFQFRPLPWAVQV
jgi:hypothetical protein